MKYLIALAFIPIFAFAEESAPAAKPAQAAKSEAASPKVRLKTNLGDIVIQLDEKHAPITCENFLSYVNKKHYDGTVFHRVIKNFMIQGGGFDKNLVEKPTAKPIKNESKNGLKNSVGTIAMARTNDPDSATAQFFINVTDNTMLDFPNNNGYAVFGKVVDGMEVVNKIRTVATSAQTLKMRHPLTGQMIAAPADDVPNDKVIIESATVVK